MVHPFSVDFSGRGAVATGRRKPVVGGRAVHSSDSSLVGYRPSTLRRGERTNERLRGLPLLPLFLHTRENECTHVYRVGGPSGWSSLRSTSIGSAWLLVPRTPPFVYYRDAEGTKGHPRLRVTRLPPFLLRSSKNVDSEIRKYVYSVASLVILRSFAYFSQFNLLERCVDEFVIRIREFFGI